MSEGAGHMNHITKWGAKLRGVPEQDTFSCPVAWEFGSVWRTFAKLPSLVSGMGGLDHSGDCEISFLPFCCLLYRLPGAVWRILLCFFKGDGQKKTKKKTVWTSSWWGFGKPWWYSLEEQTFKRLRTHRGRYRKKYIYIFFSIQVFFSQKEKNLN